MKPALMIHQMDESLFDLPLEDYILTFDDGLYSQYYYFDRISKLNTEKIFFISSGIINVGIQSNVFPDSVNAHSKAFNGNYEDYMSLNQIKELMSYPLVSIGGHSHYHKNLNNIGKLTDKIKHIVDDTKLMLSWFEENLDLTPTKFCYPYNNDCNGLYKPLLKSFGFTEFYGSERVSVETLLDS